MSAPAAAPHRTISQFCDHVCMYVRFRPDHEAITAELTAHLEDHKDAILEIHPDMTLWEAERRAVEAMGNPEELGRWLDSIHNALLGWLQIWFVRAVCILAALALVLALPQAERVHNQAADIQRLRSWGPAGQGACDRRLRAGRDVDVAGLRLLHPPVQWWSSGREARRCPIC